MKLIIKTFYLTAICLVFGITSMAAVISAPDPSLYSLSMPFIWIFTTAYVGVFNGRTYEILKKIQRLQEASQ